jgi:uncharacterized membrane protein YqiK
MTWFVVLVVVVILAILGIVFLNRFYRKATREVSLIRTGAGGQRVVLDGGCLALPFLHKVSEVNMRTTKLEVERTGAKSVITADRLRIDVEAEFYVRVNATEAGVATAAQALAGKSFRAAELGEILDGKLVDAMLSVAAGYTMDELQDNRGKYAAEVRAALNENLAQNGLLLESVSLTRLDQTPFGALDENNAFNALGMRRLAEIIAVNKKERAAIEADAEVSVRQSQLEATKRKLVISQEEEEATIAQQRQIETARAQSNADVAEEQASAERRREAARIGREEEVRSTEIAKDRKLRELEVAAKLATEAAEVDKAVKLAAAQAARADEVTAKEAVNTARETAAANRERDLALIRAKEQALVDDTRVKSEAGTMATMSEARLKAAQRRAASEKEELLARAEGTAALVAAENKQSAELIRMKLDQARITALPDIVGKMMKPAEKIETIRINHITGMGGNGGGGGEGDKSTMNQVVDGVLSMALQLPAVQKLGEEIGVNIGGGAKGLAASLENAQKKKDDTSEE